jgi:hypothetical protein
MTTRRSFLFGMLAVPAAAWAGRLLPAQAPQPPFAVTPRSVWGQAMYQGRRVGEPFLWDVHPAKNGCSTLTATWDQSAATWDGIELHNPRLGKIGTVRFQSNCANRGDSLTTWLTVT